MDRPIILNAAMVRAVLSGQKTQTRRPIKPQPPTECSIHYMLGAESWLSRDQQNPLSHYWEAWWGESFLNRPKGHLCGGHKVRSPFGQTGDRLWVREMWAWPGEEKVIYHADQWAVDMVEKWKTDPNYPQAKWTPSIHMPRWASRITLPLISVRVERVQDISEADVWAEGITVPLAAEVSGKNWADIPTLHDAWREVWVSIYGQSSWDANHWVWVAEWEEAEVAR